MCAINFLIWFATRKTFEISKQQVLKVYLSEIEIPISNNLTNSIYYIRKIMLDNIMRKISQQLQVTNYVSYHR